MDHLAAITAQLTELKTAPGRTYTERDSQFEPTGKYWVNTSAGLAIVRTGENDHGNGIVNARIVPWSMVSEVKIRFTGRVASTDGPDTLTVRIESPRFVKTANMNGQGGRTAVDRDELAAFALDVIARQR